MNSQKDTCRSFAVFHVTSHVAAIVLLFTVFGFSMASSIFGTLLALNALVVWFSAKNISETLDILESDDMIKA